MSDIVIEDTESWLDEHERAEVVLGSGKVQEFEVLSVDVHGELELGENGALSMVVNVEDENVRF